MQALSNHVVSQGLAEKLWKAGWPQEGSAFYWASFRNESSPREQWGITHTSLIAADEKEELGERSYLKGLKFFAAPLATELMERLKNSFDVFFGRRLWYAKEPIGRLQFSDENICNALAKLALLLIKEGKMTF
jgi:hypothetical protein